MCAIDIKMKNRMELLIKILLDKTAREDERDDAALDLRNFNDLKALQALSIVASDPNEAVSIVDNCAESFAQICVNLKFFDKEQFLKLIPFAQKIVFDFVMYYSPEIIDKDIKSEFLKK